MKYFSLTFNLIIGLAIVVGYWAVMVKWAGESKNSSGQEN